ncbi:hypothetical protein ALP05_00673 [Pseudomonas caricapapayae]|uniref:Uncharacterized protein n=1 Tax=Pseudomonas caricapapayae TaxID=46678 RepID=A0A3M6F762_9PSED|nr:hypothetical protein [Pseudomonas caricapapayae]RMV76442.1 hypothetical protein ALP05_00673 [Pseudomonas caricapapayae]
MSELFDLKELDKKSEVYQALMAGNKAIRKHEKRKPCYESQCKIDEAVRIARRHNTFYLNEDGDFDVDVDGNVVTEEITPIESMLYVFGLMVLTDDEKREFRKSFLGA